MARTLGITVMAYISAAHPASAAPVLPLFVNGFESPIFRDAMLIALFILILLAVFALPRSTQTPRSPNGSSNRQPSDPT